MIAFRKKKLSDKQNACYGGPVYSHIIAIDRFWLGGGGALRLVCQVREDMCLPSVVGHHKEKTKVAIASR